MDILLLYKDFHLFCFRFILQKQYHILSYLYQCLSDSHSALENVHSLTSSQTVLIQIILIVTVFQMVDTNCMDGIPQPLF